MGTKKAIGTAFESKMVKIFEDAGFETCRRIVLHGANDEGDLHIGAVNQPSIIIECKSRKIEVAYKGIEDFLCEAYREYKNATNAEYVNPFCALVALKRPNLGPNDGYLIWKNRRGITVRARIGDVINKENFTDCTNEDDRISKLILILSV